MENLIRANLHYLSQAESLLERMDDGCFAAPAPGFYNSSVGGHLRHCIEHYQAFLAGMEDGKVDYDCRARDERLEQRTGEAVDRVRGIKAAMERLAANGVPASLLVKMDCGVEEIEWQSSTIGRELQFLVSHTVHHYAMIGGICRDLGVEMEADFGVAPSTVRHRAAMQPA